MRPTTFLATLMIGLIGLLGCQTSDNIIDDLESDQFSAVDGDGDGFSPAGGDCDDANPYVNPGMPEFCDEIDNDCDGDIDDEDSSSIGLAWMFDGDGDNYGKQSEDGDAQHVYTCDIDTFEELVENTGGDPDALAFYVPAQYDTEGDILVDCDDDNAAVNPGAPEICDELDNDCDGLVDDGVPSPAPFYQDADGDGYGDASVSEIACEAPEDYVADDSDCDDTDAAVNPGVTEVCDALDTDEDCDALADNDDPSADPSTQVNWYVDEDDDGWGNPPPAALACDDPTFGLLVLDGTDCDDEDAAVNPAAVEICNEIDDDCDDVIDPDSSADAETWYLDFDGDAYGDAASTTVACEAPTDYVGDATDCDDAAAAVNPGATEVCNGIDDDCDLLADDADSSTDPASMGTFYQDFDVDTFGDLGAPTLACEAPTGYVLDATDCDDASASNYPGAPESCDLVDNDCDSIVDEGVETTFYADSDGDSFGNPGAPTLACEAPTSYVADDNDCDDADSSAYPGAPESCDDVDDDCDGTVDEDAVDETTWFRDNDGDLYGNAAISVVSCDAPTNFVDTSGDCDDNDPSINPGATEVFNLEDDDCDGLVDEDLSCVLQVLIFDGGGEATSLTGAVSDDPDLDGEWYPSGVTGVMVVPASLGGDNWEYDITMDLCLTTGGTVVVDGEFANGESICDDAVATIYGFVDEVELDSAVFPNGDGTCAIELSLP